MWVWGSSAWALVGVKGKMDWEAKDKIFYTGYFLDRD